MALRMKMAKIIAKGVEVIIMTRLMKNLQMIGFYAKPAKDGIMKLVLEEEEGNV